MFTFKDYVEGFLRLQAEGRACPLGQASFPPPPKKGGPRVMLFAPHPDDECIVGGLALRLLREAGAEVITVAVTQGSRKDRQAARLAELANACRYLGFELVTTRENGLENVNRKTQEGQPAVWAESVRVIEGLIRRLSPTLILMPHEKDANSTHEGVNLLVRDALKAIGPGFACRVVETEFWAPMAKPNLMVEVSPRDLTDLLEALSFHIGEVSRNPYHLTLPAWMMDNVRRGGEIVGVQGGAAPDFPFATLYRILDWNGRELAPAPAPNKVLSAGESARVLLG